MHIFYNLLIKEKYIWAFIIVKLDSINSTDGKIAKPPTTSIYVFRRSNFTGNNFSQVIHTKNSENNFFAAIEKNVFEYILLFRI